MLNAGPEPAEDAQDPAAGPRAGGERWRIARLILATGVGLAAAVALIGWLTGHVGTAGLGLGGRPLTPLDATAFVLIVLGGMAGAWPRTRRLGAALGGAAAAGMGAALLESIVNVGSGPDRLLAPGALAAAHISGRPSPQSATILLLLALAVVLRPDPRGRLAADLCALVAGLVSVACLIGLAIGWEPLTEVAPGTAIPVLAALGGLTLAAALVDSLDGALRRAPAARTGIAGALALALTLVATFAVAHDARRRADETQRGNLHLAVDATRTATAPVIEGLDDLATLYAATGSVAPGLLTLAAGKLLRNPAVTVVSVLRELTDAQRPAFERRYGRIVEPGGGVRRAARRPRYVVILHARRRDSRPLSPPGTHVDVAADPVRRPTLALAARTGRPSASAPTRSLQTGRAVVAVYLPVTRLSGRRSAIRVAIVFDTAVLSRLIAAALPPGVQAEVSDERVAFPGGTPDADAGPGRVLALAGRRWTVRVERTRPAWAGVLAAGGVGLSLTLLIVLAAGLLVRRERTALALAVHGLQQRDAAARAAARARRRSRFLEESATDVLFLSDPGLRLTYVSPAAWTQLGLQPDGLLGQAGVELVHPDEAGLVTTTIDKLAQSDAVVTVTHRMRHGDGRWIWMETLLRAVRDRETGAFVEVQGSTRDVTARRETEHRLREAENRFRSAFDEAPLGMAVVGLGGEVLQINRALCEMAGEEAADLRGTAFDALLHQADADTHREAREALLDGDLRAHDAELRVVRPSGHIVWAAVSTALVLGADGQPRHYLTQVQDVSERRRAEGQLQFLADHDPHTGLLNRRAFERSLREHLTRVRRYGVQGAVLVVDLDSFAAVTERVGRAGSDKLIVAVARALQRRLRASDLLARFGGDHFAVLLPHADLQEALVVGGALVDAVRSVQAGEGLEPLTASVGVALVDRPELRGDDLLIDADLAMYDAKQAGRDRVRQAERPLTGRQRFRPTADLAEQLREALREDRLVLYAEPIVELESDRVVQLELLLRLRGRDGDLQAPASFLPATDHPELVRELDRWAVTRAVALLAEHSDGPSVAVKVSVRSLAGEELVDTLGHELTARNVDPRRLTVELDEREAAAHLPRVQELARDLEHLGCPLALDDFGGGFGSFYSLKHLPYDVLKIDGGFVRHCVQEHADQLVIGAMADMAAGSGARTVAKFVGDDLTAAVVRRLGVDAGQGAYFGGPVPAAQAFAEAARRP